MKYVPNRSGEIRIESLPLLLLLLMIFDGIYHDWLY